MCIVYAMQANPCSLEGEVTASVPLSFLYDSSNKLKRRFLRVFCFGRQWVDGYGKEVEGREKSCCLL